MFDGAAVTTPLTVAPSHDGSIIEDRSKSMFCGLDLQHVLQLVWGQTSAKSLSDTSPTRHGSITQDGSEGTMLERSMVAEKTETSLGANQGHLPNVQHQGFPILHTSLIEFSFLSKHLTGHVHQSAISSLQRMLRLVLQLTYGAIASASDLHGSPTQETHVDAERHGRFLSPFKQKLVTAEPSKAKDDTAPFRAGGAQGLEKRGLRLESQGFRGSQSLNPKPPVPTSQNLNTKNPK